MIVALKICMKIKLSEIKVWLQELIQPLSGGGIHVLIIDMVGHDKYIMIWACDYDGNEDLTWIVAMRYTQTQWEQVYCCPKRSVSSRSSKGYKQSRFGFSATIVKIDIRS